jgi:outer membrane protein insertion porin family
MMRRLALLLLFTSLCTIAEAQVGLRSRRGNTNTSTDLIDVNYTNPREYEIAEITVNGAETLNADALVSLSGLRVGDRIKIPGDAITNAVEKLWDQGIIGDAGIFVTNVEGDKIFLSIELSERPRLARFDIIGVNRTQEDDLEEQVKLFRGRVVTDALVKNTELSVKSYLVQKGYLDATVKVVPVDEPNLPNSVNLRVDVERGDKVRIDEIRFIGNTELADTRLQSKMRETKEKARVTLFEDIFRRLSRFRPSDVPEFFSNRKDTESSDIKDYFTSHINLNIFGGSKYVKDNLDTDYAAVVAYYNSKGYRDAQITGDSLYRSDKGNMVNLNIYVNEGQKYYFRDIAWVGNYVHSDSALSRILSIQEGDVYDMELINKRLNYNPSGADISSLYMDNGYLFFSVNPVEVSVDGDSIDVEMRIQEGPQATIRNVVVNGNERTKDHVILREVRTLPGAKFSREDVIRTQREILALGYFDQENLGINTVPNVADGTVDIEYTVAERPSDQIELSAGWGGRSNFGGVGGFIGTLGLVFNNFSIQNLFNTDSWDPLPVGDGQTFAIRAQASGRRFQTYSLSFMEPWLGGKKPNSLSVSLSRSVQRFFGANTGEFFNFNAETGSLRVNNITVGLGRRVKWPDDFFTVQNAIGFQNYQIETLLDNNGNPIGGISSGQIIGIENGSASAFTLNTTLARNSALNPIYPQGGSNLTLRVSLTPPYSFFNDRNYNTLDGEDRYQWIEYHKYMFDGETYTPITRDGKLVLNTKTNLGFVGSYGSGNPIGPFERFVMGGDGLSGQGNFLLGRDIIGLRGYQNNSITPAGRNGGIVYNKFAMQLRYPVSLQPSATIYLQGFAEAGNNWGSYKDYNPFNLYRSAGIGARIFMPAFGLIGIDWAYGFDEVPGNPEANGPQFHFTIGQQLR